MSLIIGKKDFLGIIMKEVEDLMHKEKEEIINSIEKINKNVNKVLNINEFEILMTSIEPAINRTDTIDLYLKVFICSQYFRLSKKVIYGIQTKLI